MKFKNQNFVIAGISISTLILTGCANIAESEETPNEISTIDSNEVSDEPSLDAIEAPSLLEIEDLLWSTMEGSGSVVIVYASSQSTAGIEPDGTSIDLDSPYGMYYGALDGSGSELVVDEEELFRQLGGEDYFYSAGAHLTMLTSQELGLTPEQERRLYQLSVDFRDVWIEMEDPEKFGLPRLDVAWIFMQIRERWKGIDAPAGPMIDPELADDGSYEVIDGNDAWVYQSAGWKIAIEANREAPKLIYLGYGHEGLVFLDWGETELPNRPDDTQILQQYEFEQLIEEFFGLGDISVNE